ncbi:MAG: hypothetical protein ACREEM_49705 [Blastocatellia bacterium]
MRDAECGIEESSDSHSPIRDPQSAILIRSSRSASSGRARHSAMTKGSRPSAAHNSSSTAGSRVCRAIRSISACNSSAVIVRAHQSSSARDWRR